MVLLGFPDGLISPSAAFAEIQDVKKCLYGIQYQHLCLSNIWFYPLVPLSFQILTFLQFFLQ